MFSRHIYHDRLLPYAIAFALVAGLYVWGQIEIFSLEEEQQSIIDQATYTDQIRIAHTVHAKKKETLGWKVYRNEKYGFEFRYPQDWDEDIFDENSASLTWGKSLHAHGVGFVYPMEFFVFVTSKAGTLTNPTPRFDNFSEYIDRYAATHFSGNTTSLDRKEYTVENKNVARLVSKDKDINQLADGVFLIDYGTQKDRVIEFRFSYSIQVDSNAAFSVFDQILSTVKLSSFQETDEFYLACGCGCCGGGEQKTEERCLYRSKGDDIEKIIQEDTRAKSAPICSYVGCSMGVQYKYCD